MWVWDTVRFPIILSHWPLTWFYLTWAWVPCILLNHFIKKKKNEYFSSTMCIYQTRFKTNIIDLALLAYKIDSIVHIPKIICCIWGVCVPVIIQLLWLKGHVVIFFFLFFTCLWGWSTFLLGNHRLNKVIIFLYYTPFKPVPWKKYGKKKTIKNMCMYK